MAYWIRYEHGGRTGFGTLEDDLIHVHRGDMFAAPMLTGDTLALGAVKILTPCVPGKMVALWNNFHQLAAKLGNPEPAEPLYFLKGNNSFLAHGETIRKPAAYDGKVVYEGELGVVIGKRASNVSEADAASHVFGYTCINDVTAAELINKDATFAQWTRAKSFDTFGVFGPVIATNVDPSPLTIRPRAERAGAPELSGGGHDLLAAAAGEPGLARHDAGAGRRHRLRHVDRRGLDEAGELGQRDHRRRRDAHQPLRVGGARSGPRTPACVFAGPTAESGCPCRASRTR